MSQNKTFHLSIKLSLETLISEALIKMKHMIGDNLLLCELSYLYKNKIYEQEAKIIQEKIMVLAANIDDILYDFELELIKEINIVTEKCFTEII